MREREVGYLLCEHVHGGLPRHAFLFWQATENDIVLNQTTRRMTSATRLQNFGQKALNLAALPTDGWLSRSQSTLLFSPLALYEIIPPVTVAVHTPALHVNGATPFSPL